MVHEPSVKLDINTVVKPDVQTELGLDEPPVDFVEIKLKESWADSPTDFQLKEWWEEFLLTQPMRISSLMRTLVPSIIKDEVVVVLTASKMENLDGIKFAFNRFISEVSNGKLNRIRIEAGEIEYSEKKPYTEKEKLEYLQRKNPKLIEVIEKLKLRLP